MKKIIFAFSFILLAGLTLNAQVETPQPSPFSKMEQKVGLTDVHVEYSRPGARGRTIFGDLVPMGKLWRTGANANTKITFSEDVKVGGKDLKKGTYAIFTKPNTTAWEVIFYSDANNWGTPRKWDDSKVAATVTAQVQEIPAMIENFTIMFDNLKTDSAELGIMWENTYVGMKLEVPTDKAVSASIEKVMAGPGPGDFFSSAVYYLETGKDINKAMKWIDKAVAMTEKEPRFWYLRQQSLIHAKAGKKKTAIAAAKQSLKLAEKAKNADYVKLNTDSLKEWGAI
ncbi:DUF2911 domain-containing protein [Spongiivirga citrea]|uniref:DUF2911 domain-containing protein n=1 Tax=Spongiivirga citrea TaxID=1481457 RepID=A0A6M0CUK6_9FLAO|nr:DUF2911 domain-containing protein [Spongiivirga citrea]NER17450.1 DUF2911 domain-containing protein [Spongiivirga citrea]